LHHFPAFWQVLGVIVGSTYFVAFSMSKLTFDNVSMESIFIKDRAGSASKTVTG